LLPTLSRQRGDRIFHRPGCASSSARPMTSRRPIHCENEAASLGGQAVHGRGSAANRGQNCLAADATKGERSNWYRAPRESAILVLCARRLHRRLLHQGLGGLPEREMKAVISCRASRSSARPFMIHCCLPSDGRCRSRSKTNDNQQ